MWRPGREGGRRAHAGSRACERPEKSRGRRPRRRHERHLYPRAAGAAYDEGVAGKEHHGAQSGTLQSAGISGMIACPACATECPDGSRFCLSCGSLRWTRAARSPPNDASSPCCSPTWSASRASPSGSTRRTSTASCASTACSRGRAIEAYGGVVEKYIGDAVAGVFGVPRLHEDDAERAVWAALRLLERLPALAPLVPDGEVQARIGINTGPAFVRLDVVPGAGRGLRRRRRRQHRGAPAAACGADARRHRRAHPQARARRLRL